METHDNMGMREPPPASANTLAEMEGPEGGGNDKDGMYMWRGEMMERVGAARTGSDAGGGCMGRGCGDGTCAGRGCVGGGLALGIARSFAARTQALAAAERASGFARLPDCSPAP